MNFEFEKCVPEKILNQPKCINENVCVICLSCKKIIYIDHCPLEQFEKSLESKTNFLISDHKYRFVTSRVRLNYQ